MTTPTGICTAHEGRHEKREGCVRWDGSEETRLREELAEARRNAKAWQMYHETCIGPAEGVVLRQRAERAFARATAAESALAEVRKWLQRAVEEQHHELDEDEEHEIPAQTRCGACGEESSPCTDLRCWVPHARAALARAGEQEVCKHVTREGLSYVDPSGQCTKCGAWTTTPPPGERGKGGGEGPRCGLLFAEYRRATCTLERGHEGAHWQMTPAPAQPAEHPASGGEEKP